MEKLLLYNSLTRKKEEFKPIKKGHVGMYTCGPTVYWYQHIGNLRTTLFNDFLKRILLYNSYKVNHVMNITDVDDKTIIGSKKEGIALQELTQKYEKIFLENLDELNILKPSSIVRATESIEDMTALIQKLLKKKAAYKTDDGIYFSIEKFKDYGKLVHLSKIKKVKARVRADEYDKNKPQDFALWKFYNSEDGDVFWETAIGKGRPGWHIECSAMSIKYLGEHFDIHTGGSDLLFPHHTNEIAQSEAATGKKFVNYWMHTGMITMKEGKMSKSLGSILTLEDITKLKYSPQHFRYLCLQTHYRKPLTFSFEQLDAAKAALEHLKHKIIELKKVGHRGVDKSKEYESKFQRAINEDINIPEALQVFLKTVDDSTFDTKKKIEVLECFDEVLGLGVKEMKEKLVIVPTEVQKLIDARERLRKAKLWAEADIIRQRILEKGYLVEDTEEGYKIKKI
ncbi:MAG: cysteine--tRNA ligase [Nanoarchaeota archaeon]